MSEPVSVRAALRAAGERLSAAGIDSARVDAELLLAESLGTTRAGLLTRPALTAAEVAAYDRLIGERADRIPLQHLTGQAPFRHLQLQVGPGVFIPRPETELILELAADRLAEAGTVVDLCAGSGAIALAVAQEYPQATVCAVERSPAALHWLHRNAAERAAAGDRAIEVVAGDVADDSLLTQRSGRVDVVLSNPPYVPESVRGRLSAEVGHDPDDAVFAGSDGLALMPALSRTAARLLRPGGLLVIEHDDSHADALPALLAETGSWRTVSDHADLTGRPRFVRAERV